MDSGATQPHAEAQEQLVQQAETKSLPTQPDSATLLTDTAALRLVAGASVEVGSSPALDADILAAASLGPEVAPAPPPPFAFDALGRYQRVERLVNILVAGLSLILAAPLLLIMTIWVGAWPPSDEPLAADAL